MNAKDRARYEARARIVKAMAHPTRLFILDRLAEQETCVCELTEMIGADVSTVSKHLSVLKSAGLIKDQKRGVQVYYQLRTPCVMKVFSCIEGVIENSIKEQLELV